MLQADLPLIDSQSLKKRLFCLAIFALLVGKIGEGRQTGGEILLIPLLCLLQTFQYFPDQRLRLSVLSLYSANEKFYYR